MFSFTGTESKINCFLIIYHLRFLLFYQWCSYGPKLKVWIQDNQSFWMQAFDSECNENTHQLHTVRQNWDNEFLYGLVQDVLKKKYLNHRSEWGQAKDTTVVGSLIASTPAPSNPHSQHFLTTLFITTVITVLTSVVDFYFKTKIRIHKPNRQLLFE